MASLVTNTRIAQWASVYELGESWSLASDAARQRAVQSAEGIWRTLTWSSSPFTDATIAANLEFALALQARSVLESGGLPEEVFPPAVKSLVRPYLRLNTPMSGAAQTTDTSSGIDATEVARQILFAIRNSLVSVALSFRENLLRLATVTQDGTRAVFDSAIPPFQRSAWWSELAVGNVTGQAQCRLELSNGNRVVDGSAVTLAYQLRVWPVGSENLQPDDADDRLTGPVDVTGALEELQQYDRVRITRGSARVEVYYFVLSNAPIKQSTGEYLVGIEADGTRNEAGLQWQGGGNRLRVDFEFQEQEIRGADIIYGAGIVQDVDVEPNDSTDKHVLVRGNDLRSVSPAAFNESLRPYTMQYKSLSGYTYRSPFGAGGGQAGDVGEPNSGQFAVIPLASDLPVIHALVLRPTHFIVFRNTAGTKKAIGIVSDVTPFQNQNNPFQYWITYDQFYAEGTGFTAGESMVLEGHSTHVSWSQVEKGDTLTESRVAVPSSYLVALQLAKKLTLPTTGNSASARANKAVYWDEGGTATEYYRRAQNRAFEWTGSVEGAINTWTALFSTDGTWSNGSAPFAGEEDAEGYGMALVAQCVFVYGLETVWKQACFVWFDYPSIAELGRFYTGEGQHAVRWRRKSTGGLEFQPFSSGSKVTIKRLTVGGTAI